MTSTLKVDQIQMTDGTAPTAADLGLNVSGNILQVQKGVLRTTSDQSTTSSSYVTTGLQVNITPTSTSSKILVTSMSSGFVSGGWGVYTIFRDSSGLVSGLGGWSSLAITQVNNWNPTHLQVLDEPNTTSQITYSLRVAKGSGTTFYYHWYQTEASIIAMEIAG